MSDIKSDFKKWLQGHFSKSTAYRYYGLIQNIFDKNFGDNLEIIKIGNNILKTLCLCW